MKETPKSPTKESVLADLAEYRIAYKLVRNPRMKKILKELMADGKVRLYDGYYILLKGS